MERIISIFIHDKSIINPLDGTLLSKRKRIEKMFDIVQNNQYCIEFTIEERILASQLITKILEEK